jgi:hypothetical protein
MWCELEVEGFPTMFGGTRMSGMAATWSFRVKTMSYEKCGRCEGI